MQEGSSSPLSKRQKKFDAVDNPDTTRDTAQQHDGDDHRQISTVPHKFQTEEKSLHIAPMMRVSNREFRQLVRILSKRCVLWTEMVVDETIYYCSRSKSDRALNNATINREKVDIHLDYDRSVEHPIVCQIGGINPLHTAFACKLMASEEYGYTYDEINLNMGCPSKRVRGKQFGAVLMTQVDRACELVQNLKQHSCGRPISVKLRIGVDDRESFDQLCDLVRRLHAAGCDRFYVHARKVHLRGLNPAQNRMVPPLNYPLVYKLCEAFPDCDFWINGGISGLQAARELVCGAEKELPCVQKSANVVPCAWCRYPNGSCIAPRTRATVPRNLKGCMLGRAAMDNPSIFWDCDRYFYGEAKNPCSTRRQVLDQYIIYLEEVYPRRCCDDRHDVPTNRIPSPKVEHTRDACDLCADWRRHMRQQHSPTQKYASRNTVCIAPDSNNGSSSSSSNCISNGNKKKKTKVKITTHVVRRSLNPVLGLFFGLSTSRVFRRRCEELIQDQTIRNCGPAFILVSALRDVPDGLLDAEFIRTEDLPSSHIVEHVSPQQKCSS